MAVKTDRNDARSTAQATRVGWFTALHLKTLRSQEMRMLPTNRKALLSGRVAIENEIRGTLKAFGLKVGPVTVEAFKDIVIELTADYPRLAEMMRPMLAARDLAIYLMSSDQPRGLGGKIALMKHPSTASPRQSSRAVLFSLSSLITLTSSGVDHEDVEARVLTSGEIGGGYLMLTGISAAIAILGLLLSSPAVVIGAMLLSPLMGPIVLLGFSFWTVDWASTRKALTSLAAGFGIALLVSIALTTVSPLKEPTAEILARSRPTLFDLLVAIFSGIAGGYAVVRHRGETVIGVAIATALMPPLAVVGFGVGTRAWSIAGGALLLFFTNLIAIALAAAAVAALSGFRPQVRLGERGWIRHAAVGAILVILCIPLTLSLQSIALESRANAQARSDVGKFFGPKSRIASLSVRADKGAVHVSGLIATPRYINDVSNRLAASMRAKLHAPVAVALDQVVLADPSQLNPRAAPDPVKQSASDPVTTALADLRAAVPFSQSTILYDRAVGAGMVMLSPQSGLDLAGARALETGLRSRPGEAEALVVPPVQALAPISILVSRTAPPALGAADLQRWALKRWRASSVDADLCRSGRRGIAAGVVQAALANAFAPLPITLTSSRAACDAVAQRGPFLIVKPGPFLAPSSADTAASPPPSPAGEPTNAAIRRTVKARHIPTQPGGRPARICSVSYAPAADCKTLRRAKARNQKSPLEGIGETDRGD